VDSLKAKVLALAHVRFTMARIEFMGLLSNGEKSAVFVGRGIEPAKELELSGSRLPVDSGVFLGQNPNGQGDAEVVVARGLAKTLKARIGEYLTLMTTTSTGALNAMDVKVVGIYSTGVPEYDERALMVDLRTAQQLLVTRKVSKLVVVLDETARTREVASAIAARIPEVSLRRWDELATFYKAVVQLYTAIFAFLGVIIFVIVVLSSSNTMMMSIMERTREIGTQLAVGTSRFRLLLNFLYEGLMMGVFGGLLGLAVGAGLAELIDNAGLSMPPPPGGTTGYPLVVDLVPGLFAGVFLLIVLTTVTSTIAPALKASRMKIVDALGHV
jgi:putative ABC transport system permease protein